MSSQKEKKFQRTIIMVLAALVLALLVIVVFLVIHSKTNNDTDKKQIQRDYVVTKDNVDDIKQQLQEPVSDAYYTVTMTTEWNCSAATNEVADAYVANSTENTRTVYFNLLLPDTNEVIYSSPFIPVGEELRGLTLDQALPEGKNSVWVEYHLVDENEQELTTVTVTATIAVKK